MDERERLSWLDDDEGLAAMLAELPGDMPPEDLFGELDRALGVVPRRPARGEAKRRWALRMPGSARGASWAVRGAAAGLPGTGAFGGLRSTFAGMGSARFALGPLAPRRKSKRTLWQRALGIGG